VDVELAVDIAHLLRVIEDQRDEDVDRTLVGEPEPERIASQRDAVQRRRKEDAGTERNPYSEAPLMLESARPANLTLG
jgi:hypothetical protein